MVLHGTAYIFRKKREGEVGTVSSREDNIAIQAEWNNGSREIGKYSLASP